MTLLLRLGHKYEFCRAARALPPSHADAFFMRCVAIRHDASTYMHGSIVTDRNATHDKRILVGRVGLALPWLAFILVG